MWIAEFILASISVIAVDQVSKAAALRYLPRGEGFIGRRLFIRLQLVCNQSTTNHLRLLAMVVTLCTVLFSAVLLIQRGEFFANQVAQLGLGAAIGGATSNLVDRLSRDAVIDFIDVHPWPVFNLADVAIVLGLAVAFWFMR